jgi:hypothetical protein
VYEEGAIYAVCVNGFFHAVYHTRQEARTGPFFYIEALNNRQRQYSALGYVSPEAYEKSLRHLAMVAKACRYCYNLRTADREDSAHDITSSRQLHSKNLLGFFI